MTKATKKYFSLFVFVMAPFFCFAAEAHKPPILTTTAIIEVHEEGQFNKNIFFF